MRSLAALVALACAVSTGSLTAQRMPPMAPQTGSQPIPGAAPSTSGQTPDPSAANLGFGLGLGSQPAPNPLTQPTLTPGMTHLMELETQFAAAVAAGGGKAFASWFADEGVTLANGRPPVIG